MALYTREIRKGGIPQPDEGRNTLLMLLDHLVSDMSHDGNWYEDSEGWPVFRVGSTEFIYQLGPDLVLPLKALSDLLKIGRRFHRDSPQIVSAYARILLGRIFGHDEDLIEHGLALLTRDDAAPLNDQAHYNIRGALMLLLTQDLPFDDKTESKLRELPWTEFLQFIADYLEGNADEYLGAMIALQDTIPSEA